MKMILVAIDFSDVTKRIVSYATQFAKWMKAQVIVLHVAEPNPDFVGYEAGPDVVRDQMAKVFHQEHRAIQALAEQMRSQGTQTTALLIQGPTVQSVLEEAHRCHADMIMMGSHGHGALYRALVGGVSEGVLRKSEVPVFIVPSREEARE